MSVKNHSLKQVQTRDEYKTRLFKKLGWTVLVYEDRYYTPETAFADIISFIELVDRDGTAPPSVTYEVKASL